MILARRQMTTKYKILSAWKQLVFHQAKSKSNIEKYQKAFYGSAETTSPEANIEVSRTLMSVSSYKDESSLEF